MEIGFGSWYRWSWYIRDVLVQDYFDLSGESASLAGSVALRKHCDVLILTADAWRRYGHGVWDLKAGQNMQGKRRESGRLKWNRHLSHSGCRYLAPTAAGDRS